MFVSKAGCMLMFYIMHVSGVEGKSNSICALKGSSVNLDCSSPRSAVNIKWYIVNMDGAEYFYDDLSEHENLERFSLLEDNFTLTIRNLTEADGQLYCCSETTPKSGPDETDSCLQNSIQLKVIDLLVDVRPAAEVTEGQRVTLTCSTSCPLSENTNYIWFLNSRPLSLTKTPNKHLIKDAVSGQDEGNYSCAVETFSSAGKTLTVLRRSVNWKPVAARISVSLLVCLLLTVFVFRKLRTFSQSSRSEAAINMEEINSDPIYADIQA